MSRRHGALAALSVLFVAVGTTWATLSVPFHNPDELRHVNSAIRLAYGGGWPPPGTQRLSPVMLDARAQVAAGIPADEARQRISAANAKGEVLPHVRVADVDQMTQHPPGFYLLDAAFLKVTGLADARWDQALLGLRVLGVLMFAAAVPFAAAAAFRLTGSVVAAMAAGAFPLCYVQFASSSGTVSNDALVVLAGSAVTYLVVRVLTGDMRWRTAALLGLVQGIGLFAKSIPLLALPMIAAAYLLATGSPLAERLRKGAFVALVAFGSGGWWWARNLVEFGTIQPTGVDPAAPSSFDPSLGAFLPQGLDLLLRRTIGDPTAFWPTPVAYAVAVATVVLVLLALRMRRTRRVLLVILSFWVIAMVMIVVNSYAYYRGSGLISGLNGRYAFGGIEGVAVAVGVGLSTLLPERRARQVSAGIVGVTAVISAYGLWSGLGRFERLSGISSLPGALRRWSDWTPLAGGELAAVVTLDVLAALGCLLVVLRLPIESRTAFGNHLPGDDPARVDLGDSAVSPPDGDHRPD